MINLTGHIKWKGIDLGNHAALSVEYVGNVDIRVIPRAKGVKIWSTEELGGGYLRLTVSGFVAKETRVEVEQYFAELDSALEFNAAGDLVVASGTTSFTLTDCYLESLSQDTDDLKAVSFSMKFVKSL